MNCSLTLTKKQCPSLPLYGPCPGSTPGNPMQFSASFPQEVEPLLIVQSQEDTLRVHTERIKKLEQAVHILRSDMLSEIMNRERVERELQQLRKETKECFYKVFNLGQLNSWGDKYTTGSKRGHSQDPIITRHSSISSMHSTNQAMACTNLARPESF